MRQNFNVGNFKYISLSLYGLFLRLIITLAACFLARSAKVAKRAIYF